MNKKKSTSAESSAPARTPRVLGPDTVIADVTDYALELYARERAQKIEAEPDAGGLPGWMRALVMLLPTAFLVVFVQAMASGGLTGKSAVLAAVLGSLSLVTVVGALFMRAARLGQLTEERTKQLMELDQTVRQKFEALGSKCYGCGAAYKETFATGAQVCGTDLQKWLDGLRELKLDLELTRPPDDDEPATVKPANTKG